MTISSRTTILILSISQLTAFGFGCRRTSSPPSLPSTPTSSSEEFVDIYLPPPPAPETEHAQYTRELQEAIARFGTAKTFRTKLSLNTAQGLTIGQIDIVKPDRFYGTIQTPTDQKPGEVIGVASDLYVKLPDNKWFFIKSKKISKALLEAFRSSMSGNDVLVQQRLSGATQITKRRDESRSCDAYRLTLQEDNGTSLNVEMCLAKGFPISLETETNEGSVKLEYFDFNTLFTIERPTIVNR